VKALVYGERWPPTGFEVVSERSADVEVVLTLPWFPIDAAQIEALPRLRVIGTASVGYDHIDVEAAEARGVAVVSVPDYCTEEVADHTLALLYALVRGIVVLDRSVRGGGWDPRAAGGLRVLAGLRVGVVGLGRIGSAVSRRLLALGCEVWATDIAPVALSGVRVVSLGELLSDCDVVTLHVPLTAETRGLIGPAELERMRRDALLVNTARGPVVHVEAVVAALRSGRLGGAALDVLPVEPPSAPLAAPNLIVTPHAAFYSEESEALAYRLCVERVRELVGA
jgi:D-3-phosphoglycerate dehydrogenase / 2-oxoglutarate reductase